ncbi:hypothetical protein JCM11641_000221 [Rhodosporidiobolus odoratus]
MASSELAAPRQPSISFFWATYQDSNFQIPSCSGFQVYTTANGQAAVQPVKPFWFTAAAPGYEPSVMEVTEDIGGQFTWNAQYPTGTTLTLAMADSANNSGGAVDGYTIVPGYSNCTVFNETMPDSAPITYSYSPHDRPCDEIDLELKGGTPPYTVSVLAGTSGAYANLTGVEERKIKLKNVVPAGQTFHFFITDSQGQSSPVTTGIQSALNLSTCNSPSHPSKTPIGAIVGGVVGGIALALLIALLAWWLVRRRRQQAAAQYRKEQALQTSEFRDAQGQAPLVEPFTIPLAASAAGVGEGGRGEAAGWEDHSPSSGDGSYDKSLIKYPSPSPQGEHVHLYPHTQPSPPHPGTGHYPRHPSDPAATLYDYSDSHPHHPSQYASYDSNHSGNTVIPSTGSYDPTIGVPPSSAATEPHPSSLALRDPPPSSAQLPPGARRETSDELANPEEFNYRLFDSAANGTWPSSGQQLPPGAGRYA